MEPLDRLYVISRRDLGRGAQAVQSAHAVAEFMLQHPGRWKNHTLVLLSVDDLDELEVLHKKAAEELPTVVFLEPDLDFSFTAFAAGGASTLFQRLSLLR